MSFLSLLNYLWGILLKEGGKTPTTQPPVGFFALCFANSFGSVLPLILAHYGASPNSHISVPI